VKNGKHKLEEIAHYDRIAKRHDELANKYYFLRRMETIQDNVPKNSKILDVGCGTGRFLMNLEYSYAVGMDLSFQMLSVAREKLKKKNTCFVQADAENAFPFRDSSFDAVLFMDSIEHIPKIEKTLCEAHRVVKENGIAIISTPNSSAQILWDIVDFFGLSERGRQGPTHKLLELKKLIASIEKAGFDVEKIEKKIYLPAGPEFALKFSEKLEKIFNDTPMSNIAFLVVLVCRKRKK